MFEYLTKIKNSNELAAFYADPNDITRFIFGKIIAIDDCYIAIQGFSTNGCADGIIVKPFQCISRVETGSKYCIRMKKLIKANSVIIQDNFIDNANILEAVLKISMDTEKVISIELLQSGYDDVCGIIRSFDNDICTVQQIDQYGYDNGVSYIRLNEITQLSLDSEDEHNIGVLWKVNKRS